MNKTVGHYDGILDGASKLRPAIVCQRPDALSETFVRRHILHLNSADTLTLSEIASEEPGSDSSSSRIVQSAEIMPVLGQNRVMRWLIRRLSHGFRARPIAKLLWRNIIARRVNFDRVDYLLFEFGYLLVRNWDYAIYSGKPYFIYFRGQDASRLLSQRAYVEALRCLVPRASGVIAVSQSLIENLRAQGIKLPAVRIIASGVDTRLFVPQEKDWNLFTSIGRFVEKKGHCDTLRAFVEIVKHNPSARLSLIGDGPALPKTKDLSAYLGLEDQVTFHGALPHAQVRAILARSGYYLQSSKTAPDGDEEGFPSAIQEALAAGCVVASSSHAGAKHFLTDGETALLSHQGDPAAMTANLVPLLNDRATAEYISSNARALAIKNFDQSVSVSRLEEFVCEMLQSHKRCTIGTART